MDGQQAFGIHEGVVVGSNNNAYFIRLAKDHKKLFKKDIFLHRSKIRGKLKDVPKNSRIRVEVVEGARGPEAVWGEILELAPPESAARPRQPRKRLDKRSIFENKKGSDCFSGHIVGSNKDKSGTSFYFVRAEENHDGLLVRMICSCTPLEFPAQTNSSSWRNARRYSSG